MKRLAIGAAGAAVVLIVAALIYLNFIREDAPDEFVLTDQSDTTESTDSTGSTDNTDSGSTSSDSTDSEEPGSEETDANSDGGSDDVTLDGGWTVASGSEAGYRVVEDLRGIQDFEAVGRTDQVAGSLDITGTTVSAASFEVDIASITSDDSRRDGQFTGPIMNASEFPTATLTLTEPIELDGIPDAGSAVATTATGELTLRGVTNPVDVAINAQILGSQIEIVASIDVLFSDYGIDNPSNPFVTVRDEGKVEVRLVLDQL